MQKPTLLAAAALAVLLQCSVATLPALAAEHTVRVISDYKNLRMYFKPKRLTIAPGDTVTWVNEVKEAHNVLSFPDGFPDGAEGFISPDLTEAGQTWSHTFTAIGSYEYHCLPHLPMGMRGVVIVGRPSTDDEFHRPSKEEVAAYRDRLLEYFDEDEYQYKVREREQQGSLSPGLQEADPATRLALLQTRPTDAICLAPPPKR